MRHLECQLEEKNQELLRVSQRGEDVPGSHARCRGTTHCLLHHTDTKSMFHTLSSSNTHKGCNTMLLILDHISIAIVFAATFYSIIPKWQFRKYMSYVVVTSGLTKLVVLLGETVSISGRIETLC